MLPLALMGNGLRRLTTLLLTVLTSGDGIVLVDEIETGLHHSMLPGARRAIASAAKRASVQIVATTHSYECVRAAREAFEGSAATFRLHRLERRRSDGKIVAKMYDDEAFAGAMNAELEVR
jgi:predicted ATPase